MPKKLSYRVVESRRLHSGYIFELVKDRFELDAVPGKVFTRELIVHPGAVVIVPFADKDHILLLRQFRYAAKGDLWEIPAGTLERGEPTLACAKRELEEETGFKAAKWKFLTKFYSAPGICDEVMTLYAAEGLRPGRKDLDADEWIEHRVVSFRDALRMVKSGAIADAKTLAGILWVAAFGARR